MRIYKKYYKVVFEDKTEIRELKSDLPFTIEVGKGYIRNNSPKAKKITHVSSKEVERLKREHNERKD